MNQAVQGGRATSKVGVPTFCLSIFFENCMKMRVIRPRREGVPDASLGSAIVITIFDKIFRIQVGHG